MNYDKEEKETLYCEECGYEEATISHEERNLCSGCFVDEVVSMSTDIETYSIKHYTIDCEHIGTDDDIDEVAEFLIDYASAEKL